MLGCFLYLRIAFKLGFLTFSTLGSKSEYWEMLRFFTILPKKLLETSAVHILAFTVSQLILSLALNFSDSEAFTILQKGLLSETFPSFKFS